MLIGVLCLPRPDRLDEFPQPAGDVRQRQAYRKRTVLTRDAVRLPVESSLFVPLTVKLPSAAGSIGCEVQCPGFDVASKEKPSETLTLLGARGREPKYRGRVRRRASYLDSMFRDSASCGWDPLSGNTKPPFLSTVR